MKYKGGIIKKNAKIILTKTSIIKRLERFNEKAEKLINLSFSRNLRGSGLRIQSTRGEPVIATRTGPRGEQFDSFILTLRLFKQDNDQISIRKISECYESTLISEELSTQFSKSRANFNRFLDQNSTCTHNNKTFTNREILDIYLYGEYAHMNEEKREIYHRITSMDISEAIYTNEFVKISGEFLNLISFVKELNTRALEEISS